MKTQLGKNTVFLFGAGAAIGWGGPTTDKLTELVRNSGFTTTDNQTKITEFIYSELLANGFNNRDVNFETIINVIEELISYYAHSEYIRKIPSLLSVFLTPKFEEKIFNFSLKEGKSGHNYQLEIPKGVAYSNAKLSQHNESPQQFFLMHLLAEIIFEINVRSNSYAYHSKEHHNESLTSLASEQFVKWIQAIAQRSNIRMYTLNYDRIFKILLERAGISVFEGFDCGEFIDYEHPNLRANVRRILTDFDSPVYYNLHGNTYWNVRALDNNQLPNPEIVMNPWPNVAMGHDFALTQVEKGKTIMVTNIITGYQKAQRTLITPLKQMQAAFDRDCCFAEEIFVVGYSIGDAHINESIKTALRHNSELKLTFINPDFTNDIIDFDFLMQLAPFRERGNSQPYTIHPKISHAFFNGVVMIYTLKFEEYLSMFNNPQECYKLQRPH